MRREKQLILDEVKEQIEEHGDFAVFQYSNISANKIGEFRTSIANLGGDVQMIRKRILVKAAEKAGVNLELSDLTGQIGLAFSGQDSVEMTKAVYSFSKDTNESLNVLGGRLDGKLYDASQVKALSQLPGKKEMRAQLLGLFTAPLSQTVAVMNAILTAVPHCLENKVKKET